MNRDRPDLTDSVYEQVAVMAPSLEKDIIVIEAGSKRPQGCSKYMTHWFKDKPYRGRYHAFNKGLEIAREEHGDHDYYWFVCNDIEFPEEQDTLTELVESMEGDSKMALIGPAESNQDWYPGATKKDSKERWHKVATVHGLAQLIRGNVIREIGYMNPEFHYSQGAGTEYAYKLYSKGWFLAYSHRSSLTHAGGSTYGKVTEISRHEYQRRANIFASKYLRKHYGTDWDRKFAKALPEGVDSSNYSWQRKLWETSLPREAILPLPIRELGSRFKRLLFANKSPTKT